MSAKEEKIAKLCKMVEEGSKSVYNSEEWKSYLRTMAKFHNYSARNCLLILLQNPNASHVAGFSTWKNTFHRYVKKGEHGIGILGGRSGSYTKQETNKETGAVEDVDHSYTSFFPCTVFDVAQTEGEDLPTVAHVLTGDVEQSEEIENKIANICPFPVEFEYLEDGAHGYMDEKARRVVVCKGMSHEQTIKSLIHETAHALLVDEDKSKDRWEWEVEAESVAYAVSGYLGIDTASYSFGYIAGWARDKDMKYLQSNQKLIRDTAAKIIDGIGEK